MSDFNQERVARAISLYGYHDSAIATGIAYALEHRASCDNAAFCLALSRILYSDAQLADGELFDGDIDEAEDNPPEPEAGDPPPGAA